MVQKIFSSHALPTIATIMNKNRTGENVTEREKTELERVRKIGSQERCSGQMRRYLERAGMSPVSLVTVTSDLLFSSENTVYKPNQSLYTLYMYVLLRSLKA